MSKKYVIMDIDGCVLNIDHRVPFLEVGDWRTFIANHVFDTPIDQGVYIYTKFLDDPKFKCVFITSRMEENRSWTLTQLRSLFGDREFNLLMRPAGNKDKDHDLKLVMMAEHGIEPSEVFIAFDDRPTIVEAYREVGIVAYQTEAGW